jgi:hypothetical protein
MSTRFKKTQSYSIAGASSGALFTSIHELFKTTPGGSSSGTLALADGPELHMEVVSHSPVLMLKANVDASGVTELNISICVCDVCMGNSSINNAAVASVEMVVLSSSAEAADALMDSVAESVAKSLPSKGSTCFADANRAATPVSVINKS